MNGNETAFMKEVHFCLSGLPHAVQKDTLREKKELSPLFDANH